MPTPANRVPVRIGRGTKANIDIAVAAGDLKEGELVYVTDENALYTIEGGVLTQASADLSTASINELLDVDTTSAADGTALIYQNNQWVVGPVIGGVNYTAGASGGTDYTVPTGFSVWESTFSVQPTSESVNVTLSNNDFTATATATSTKDFTSQTTKNSGKLYWEIKVLDLASATANVGLTTNSSAGAPGGGGTGGFGWRSQGGNNNDSGGTAASVWSGTWAANDVLMFAIDFSAKLFWGGKNGTWNGGGDPAAGTGAGLSNWTGTPDFYFAISAGTSGQSAEVRSTYNSGGLVSIPYSIDRLEDVDTSTVAPTDGQALIWDNANSQWEPGAAGATTIDGLSDVDTSTVPPTDGQALVWDNANSQWEPGAVSGVAAINDLTDVDTSTVAPTDGQVLTWDNANSQWEPATPSAGGLPAANDGEALIYENGAWVAGPVIGGVNYTTGQTPTSTYTVPTGYTIVTDTWQIFPAGDPDVTLSNSDLTATVTSSGTQSVAGSTARSSGKWYWEVSIDTVSTDTFVGIRSTTTGIYPGSPGSAGLSVRESGQGYNDGVGTLNDGNSKGSYTSGDILMWALDLDNGEIYMGKNGTWFGTSDPSTGTNPWFNSIVAGSYYFTCYASVATEEYTQNTVLSAGSTTTIPYSIDNLDDVDTSTVAPTDGQALVWDNANSQWEPGTVSGGTSLPAALDGEALIYENGQWVAGPVIGGVNYSPAGDIHWNDVVALLDMESTGTSTVFGNAATGGVTFTDFSAVEDATVFKFGAQSMRVNGTGGARGTLSSAIGTQEFTAEGWVRLDTTQSSGGSVWSSNQDSGGASGAIQIHITSARAASFRVSSTTIHTTAALTADTWYHLALTRDNVGDCRCFVDGVLVATSSSPITTSLGETEFAVGPWFSDNPGRANFGIQGNIDEARLTIGTCRYIGNFSVQTAAFPQQLGTPVTIPYSIDKLDDVDTSTVAPTDGQVLAWDNAASKWEPGSLRTLLGIGEYADDTAAGSGGVASGALYYNTTSSDYRLKS